MYVGRLLSLSPTDFGVIVVVGLFGGDLGGGVCEVVCLFCKITLLAEEKIVAETVLAVRGDDVPTILAISLYTDCIVLLYTQ